MHRLTRIGLTLVVLSACLMSGAEVWAKGGRGGRGGSRGAGFKGGGGRSFKNADTFRGPGGKSRVGDKQTRSGVRHDPRTIGREGKTKPNSIRSVKHNRATDDLTANNEPWSRHYAREQRKLDHSKQVADHLRELSDRNGNEQLKHVADDMEQRAQSHYDKQIEQIRQRYGLNETDIAAGDAVDAPADNPPLGDSNIVDSAVDEPGRKLTGRENALFRQLRNEERKLAKRMERIERMRQLADQTGDSDMLQAADRLEEWTMNHFDRRMAQIADFQQRHDLPDLSPYLSP